MATRRFVAVRDGAGEDRQRISGYSWVGNAEVVAAMFLFTVIVQYSRDLGGWRGALATFVGIAIAYWCVSEIRKRIGDHIDARHREVQNLRRQIVQFVAAVHLAEIDNDHLRRLALAARPWPTTENAPPRGDDWSLISRSWTFWSAGLDWQDITECAECGRQRREHLPDSSCPA